MDSAFEWAVPKMNMLAKYMGNKTWLCGDLSVCDFFFAETLQCFNYLSDGKYFDKWGGKKSVFFRFFYNFMHLHGISDFMNSARNRRPWMFNNNNAFVRGPKLVLGYWNARGITQPIRYALEYTGLPYEEVRYSDRQTLEADVKGKLPLDFPNVPYLKKFDGTYITES